MPQRMMVGALRGAFMFCWDAEPGSIQDAFAGQSCSAVPGFASILHRRNDLKETNPFS
jgi:hypothetical protein